MDMIIWIRSWNTTTRITTTRIPRIVIVVLVVVVISLFIPRFVGSEENTLELQIRLLNSGGKLKIDTHESRSQVNLLIVKRIDLLVAAIRGWGCTS
jgi:hypothetical protein